MLLIATALVPALARAQSADAPARAPAATTAGSDRPVDLDRLMRLPSTERYGVDRRAGASEPEWRSRFRLARRDVAGHRKTLASLQGKLEAAASDNPWRLAPPGAQTSGESTENFTLTEHIRREREALTAAERRLRDLDVEANLAGVPAEWREEEADTGTPPRRAEDAAAPRAPR